MTRRFFEWDPTTYQTYFSKTRSADELTIPKLVEMAYEQVEIAGTLFSTFVANKTQRWPGGGAFFRPARLCADVTGQDR